MDLSGQDLADCFSAAYHQKFLELLERNCSSLSPSEREGLCRSICFPPPQIPQRLCHHAPPPPPMGGGVAAGTAVGSAPCTDTAILSQPSTTWTPTFLGILGATLLCYFFFYRRGGGTAASIIAATPPTTAVALEAAALLATPSRAAAVDLAAPSGAASSLPKEGKYIFMFHSERCRHCREVMPHFRELVGRFKNAQLRMCDEKCLQALPEEERRRLSIRGFPTFCAIEDGAQKGTHVGAPKGKQELLEMCEEMFP